MFWPIRFWIELKLLYFVTTLISMLILSTLPHYLSIRLPWIWDNYIVIASSTLSVLWHWYGKPRNLIYYLDYFFAVSWFLVEVIQTRRRALKNVLALNTIIFITNLCIKYNSTYWFYHSMWHFLSAAKCFYLTYYRASNVSSNPYRV